MITWSKYIYVIPALVIIIVPTFLSISYILALAHGNLETIFPYISDSAASTPSAGYFSQLLYFTSSLITYTFIIRYFQIKSFLSSAHYDKMDLDETVRERIVAYNQKSLYLSFAVSILISMIASFRVSEYVVLHTLAAISLFICGPLLYAMQTWISFRLQPVVNTLRTAKIRLGVTVMSSLIVFTFTTFTIWNFLIFFEVLHDIGYVIKLDQNRVGSLPYLFGAISEYIFILLICPFFATFVSEFKQITLTENKLHFVL